MYFSTSNPTSSQTSCQHPTRMATRSRHHEAALHGHKISTVTTSNTNLQHPTPFWANLQNPTPNILPTSYQTQCWGLPMAWQPANIPSTSYSFRVDGATSRSHPTVSRVKKGNSSLRRCCPSCFVAVPSQHPGGQDVTS